MAKLFFTSDTHFNHKNILRHCPSRGKHLRDNDSVEQMNQWIVDMWNRVISPEDIVYHLGDVAFGPPKYAPKWVEQLNGHKHLIKGNHDTSNYMREIGHYFETIQDYKRLNIDGHKVILFHYPILRWDCQFHGSFHLYGHVHNAPVPELAGTRSMDVGIDTNGMLGVYDWDFIKEKLEKIPKPLRDHH
jgi:calcineurin-like phosphoesterase family protein